MNKKILSILSGKSKEINILEVGCGAGIFSFIFLLKNFINRKIEYFNNEDENKEIDVLNLNLFLTDIDLNCILSSYKNFNKYKEMFSDIIIQISSRKYKLSLKFIYLSIGDLIKNFTNNSHYYHNYFDYILANLPQTPSQDNIRSKLNLNIRG